MSTQRAVEELQKTAEYLNAKAAMRTGEVAEVLRQAAEMVTVRATVLAAEPDTAYGWFVRCEDAP